MKASEAGINKTVEYFKSIGMPVCLKDLGIEPSDDEIYALAMDATKNDSVKLSRIIPIDARLAAEIYKRAK